MKIMHKAVHALLHLLDLIAAALRSFTGMVIPWEYSDRHQRRMKERINGKK